MPLLGTLTLTLRLGAAPAGQKLNVLALLEGPLRGGRGGSVQPLAHVQDLQLRLTGRRQRGGPARVPPALTATLAGCFPSLRSLTLELRRPDEVGWRWPAAAAPGGGSTAAARASKGGGGGSSGGDAVELQRLVHGLAALPNLEQLTLPSADALAFVAPLTRLTHLGVGTRRGEMRSDAVAALRALPQLRQLRLSGTSRDARGPQAMCTLLPWHLRELLRGGLPPSLELLAFADLQGMPYDSGLRLDRARARVLEVYAYGNTTWPLLTALLAAAQAAAEGMGVASAATGIEGGGGSRKGRGASAAGWLESLVVKKLTFTKLLRLQPRLAYEAARLPRECGTRCTLHTAVLEDTGSAHALHACCGLLAFPSFLSVNGTALDDAPDVLSYLLALPALAAEQAAHMGGAQGAGAAGAAHAAGGGGANEMRPLRRLELRDVTDFDAAALVRIAEELPGLEELLVGLSLPPQNAEALDALAGELTASPRLRAAGAAAAAAAAAGRAAAPLRVFVRFCIPPRLTHALRERCRAARMRKLAELNERLACAQVPVRLVEQQHADPMGEAGEVETGGGAGEDAEGAQAEAEAREAARAWGGGTTAAADGYSHGDDSDDGYDSDELDAWRDMAGWSALAGWRRGDTSDSDDEG